MNDLEEIKRKIDLVDLVGQYLTLKKSGANYKAPCPFHQEKTPSFMVSGEKQIFKCFGCGEAGDVFGFVMKMEGLEFVEALKLLADRAGVQLQASKSREEFKKEKDVKSRLYKINQSAAQIYHKILIEDKSAENARAYLENRGLNSKTINKFMLGYAPQKPIMLEYFRKKGCSEKELKLAGNPERFRDRIMFPINDIMGNVIGFTGRTLDSKIQPKYLNTPESPIFHKSRILYGLDVAKGEIKLEKKSIIVEGQMDVVLSHQAGVENVTASSGTALTSEHLKILSRYSNSIIFCFDADSAGSEAQKKAIKLAVENEVSARIIILPDGIKDPGEAVEKDPNLWRETAKNSIPALDWLVKIALGRNKNPDHDLDKLSGQEKKEIAKEILPIIKIIPDNVEKEHYVKLISKKLFVSERTIIEALNKIKTNNSEKNAVAVENHKLTLEENLIGNLLLYPEYIKLVAIDLDHMDFSENEFAALVYKSLQACYTRDNCEKDVCVGKKCQKYFLEKIPVEYKEKVNFLMLEIEKNTFDNNKDEIIKEIIDSAKRIKGKRKDAVKEKFAKLIQQAEESGNRESVKKLVEEFQYTISKK